MAKIENMDVFRNITSNITSFSHAYLFNVNSLESALPYVKEFAKQIITDNYKNKDSFEVQDISYKIDNDEFDDLYLVNPNTIGINTEEINKLLSYMETKSIREGGRRVYIIYGFERLTREISNKILKFLEEPNDNIFALLMTENIEKILPTIVSRCQVFNFIFDVKQFDQSVVDNMHNFISKLLVDKKNLIAYEYSFFKDSLSDRILFYDCFDVIERIISDTLNKRINYNDGLYVNSELLKLSKENIIRILDITNRLKCLIKTNINLNLLLDRYIIEVTEVLSICKES